MLLTLMHLGLRESEMLGLWFPKQYCDGYFHDIKRYGENQFSCQSVLRTSSSTSIPLLVGMPEPCVSPPMSWLEISP
jgi:hypothetical protein